jgi:hypothetical protein
VEEFPCVELVSDATSWRYLHGMFLPKNLKFKPISFSINAYLMRVWLLRERTN